MARKESSVLNFVVWLTGVIVSLAVGSGLAEGILRLPRWLGGLTDPGMLVTVLAGWVVIITTVVAVLLALLRK
ncbi:hypothetical protein HY448_01180 [Candidatus Pacearchaeota archaeon]|nr:hypothetical protein [Candidatus Pacearchaeota archaeon]